MKITHAINTFFYIELIVQVVYVYFNSNLKLESISLKL